MTLADATPDAPAPKAPAVRVLCVDDNRDAADTEALMLRLSGFDARACYDGPAALREVGAFHPAACLIDLNMPGMGGAEVAACLAGSPAFLVALTAMTDDRHARLIRDAGFHLHLAKPVDPAHLARIVRTVAGGWRPA